MTVEEYQQALASLSPEQFRGFRESWGGTKETVNECAQEFAYAKDVLQWERIIVFRLRQVGVTNLRTEEEKLLATSIDTAAAAQASAAAAESSAKSARRSLGLTIAALLVSLIGIVVAAFVALWTRN